MNYNPIAPISKKNYFGRKYHTKYLFTNSSLPKKTGIIRCSTRNIYTRQKRQQSETIVETEEDEEIEMEKKENMKYERNRRKLANQIESTN